MPRNDQVTRQWYLLRELESGKGLMLQEMRHLLPEEIQRHQRTLGNRTPRHDARLKTVRPRLIALLKVFESCAESGRRAGELAYDSSWMWEELRVSRD